MCIGGGYIHVYLVTYIHTYMYISYDISVSCSTTHIGRPHNDRHRKALRRVTDERHLGPLWYIKYSLCLCNRAIRAEDVTHDYILF